MSGRNAGRALNGEQRDVLAGLADIILPEAAGMPAASELDLAGEWAERALAAMPGAVAADIVRILSESAGDSPAAAIEALIRDRPADLDLLVSLVSGAYYLHPTVRSRLGYPGQVPRPLPPDEVSETPYYLTGGPLERVRRRGPIYRPTPA